MKKLFTLIFAFFVMTPTMAAKMPMPADAPKSYESECASCHMAYPPGLLNEKSWQNVMNGLNKHFGTDASLDAKDQKEISAWLQKNAATKKKYDVLAPDNRITKTPWFIREHDEIKVDVWKRAGVKSPANCGACHTTAAEGVFSEKSISIPAK
ncbi:diheme cytochrome c [Polynucleobacter sp. MWH-HuK1]|uniref:diheme cytochrome c n=1 Tax=Polynucleobacter sp. MWH-HuK1 TaxID=1743158 RepID=UPI0021041334|nr:diheme cytochrome c [Polynucleobacter sp. MWH-HuK1]